MDELIGYLIGFALIVAAIAVAIGLILTVGVFVLGGIAAVGAVCGLVVGARNFYEVLQEAHEKVPR